MAAPPASVGLGGPTTPAPEQPAAPPPHPARLAVVAVQLPSKEGGGGGGGAGISGLGLSIGRGKGRDEGAGATPITGSGGDASGYGDGASNGGGAGGVSANGQGGPPSSPATKRKPLTSSFSMLGGLALAGDGVPTSRPARALKGSSSSFVRSWDGLPLSQVQMRGLGDANVGRDTIFGFQTIGKTLVMSEIAKGKVRASSAADKLPLPSADSSSSSRAGRPCSGHLCILPDLRRCKPAHGVRLAD